MTMKEHKSVFRTADLALAAALCVSRFGVDSVEKVDQQRLVFIFERNERLNDAVDQYWRGEMLVEPQTYFNQLKVLKARIYQR